MTAFNAEIISDIPSDAFGLSVEHLGNIPDSAFSNLTEAQLAEIPPTAFQGLDHDQIAKFPQKLCRA